MMKMVKIYTRHFPLRGYKALTLLCFMFVRKDRKEKVTWITENHEAIHCRQQLETLVAVFLLWYGLEYLAKLLATLDRDRAYMSVSFEQEAYAFQTDKSYLERRRHYAWLRYVFKIKK